MGVKKMKKLIALCLLALFLLAVPAMAAKPVKTTELLDCDMDGNVEDYETRVIAEVTVKETNSGTSVNSMYFSEDYVVFYGQVLTLDGNPIEVPDPFEFECVSAE